MGLSQFGANNGQMRPPNNPQFNPALPPGIQQQPVYNNPSPPLLQNQQAPPSQWQNPNNLMPVAQLNQGNVVPMQPSRVSIAPNSMNPNNQLVNPQHNPFNHPPPPQYTRPPQMPINGQQQFMQLHPNHHQGGSIYPQPQINSNSIQHSQASAFRPVNAQPNMAQVNLPMNQSGAVHNSVNIYENQTHHHHRPHHHHHQE